MTYCIILFISPQRLRALYVSSLEPYCHRMHQLYHTLKLLSYRLRRYPLWIVVVASAIPLYFSVSWLLQELPWTSSNAWTVFVRVDEHTILKHTWYKSGRRELHSQSESYADSYLIDLQRKTCQRLPFDKFHSYSDPSTLTNDKLLFRNLGPRFFEKDSPPLLIVDRNTLESALLAEVPLNIDSLVNGRYTVHCDGNKFYTFDLLNQGAMHEQDLLLPGNVSAVDGSPHAIVTTTTSDILDCLLSKLETFSPAVERAGIEDLQILAYSLGLYELIRSSWQLVTLYAIDEEGPHWVTTWIASTVRGSLLSTSQGLIESNSFDDAHIEIREASSAKIIAQHPVEIRNHTGAMSFPCQLKNGVLDYRSSMGHILVDPRRPGKVLGSCKTGEISRVVYSANRSYYCCPRDEDLGLLENRPGTLEIFRQDTAELITSWKGKSWLGHSTPLGFADNDESLWVTDDEQSTYKINTLTGEVLDQFNPNRRWYLPLFMLCVCVCLWCLTYITACSQLRIPYPLAAIVLVWLAWNLCSLRLESVGNPNFNNRLSNQSLIAILCFGVLLLPIRILPASVSRLSTCHAIGFIIMCETILVCRFLYDHYSGIEYQIVTLIVGCTLLVVTIVVTTILKLKSRDNQRKPWQLSLTPVLFWIAVCSLVIAIFTFIFKTAKPTSLEPWLGLVRFFFYPTLGLGLWQIFYSSERALLFKMAIASVWLGFLVILFVCLHLQNVPDPYFFSEINEKLLMGCYAAVPTAVLFIALSMPFPRPIRRWCKKHLNVHRIQRATR